MLVGIVGVLLLLGLVFKAAGNSPSFEGQGYDMGSPEPQEMEFKSEEMQRVYKLVKE